MFMLWLDLDELDRVFRGRWFWSAGRPNIAWFKRADHYGDPASDLAENIRSLVQARTGQRPAGPIRLLTHLRYFGHCFNPVCFYYCYAGDGETLEAIVAEVNNTPWGERHMYVQRCEPANAGETQSFGVRKQFHVSPFMPMDLDYQWHLGAPGETLRVFMRSLRGGKVLFDATLSLRRQPASGRNLAMSLVRHPLMTVKVVAAIHWQALRLWLKGVPFLAHPAKRQQASVRGAAAGQGEQA